MEQLSPSYFTHGPYAIVDKLAYQQSFMAW